MKNLKKGDKVDMNGKYHVEPQNKGVVFTVASKPYRVCGVMLVRYLNHEKWEEIAVVLHHSSRRTYDLHEEALTQCYEQILKTV